MSINITWEPLKFGERYDLDTWRPSSFLRQIQERYGEERDPYLLSKEDIPDLQEIEKEMGLDGDGNSEASQLILALEEHGSILLCVEG